MKLFFTLFAVVTLFSSCTTTNMTMREPSSRVEFHKEDFTLSGQVSSEAKTTKILGIDFKRLFTTNTGDIQGGASGSISIASIPVIGNLVSDKTVNYSLYELMRNNPGYDVVFYPQYETRIFRPVLGIGFIAKITTVKTTARLGKL